jgi:hypothetical protein
VKASPSARGPLPRATGIVETLSAGFGVVNQQPWIVVIPVLLDLFLLFGPRLSASPLVSWFVSQPAFERSLGAGVAPEAAQAELVALADDLNVLALLSAGGISLPSVVPLLGVARGPLIVVESVGRVLLYGFGALVLGALLGCVYRALLAQGARDGEIAPLRVPAEAARVWMRIVVLALLLIGAMLVLLVPLAFVAALASLVAAGAAMLVTGVVVTVSLAAQLYLFFAPDAIFISRVGPIEAIRRSVAVVQTGVWSALTFVMLVTVTLIGMAQVWALVAAQAGWGLSLAIVGNAYIASGLIAASMVFYQERMDVLLAQRAVIAASEA